MENKGVFVFATNEIIDFKIPLPDYADNENHRWTDNQRWWKTEGDAPETLPLGPGHLLFVPDTTFLPKVEHGMIKLLHPGNWEVIET